MVSSLVSRVLHTKWFVCSSVEVWKACHLLFSISEGSHGNIEVWLLDALYHYFAPSGVLLQQPPQSPHLPHLSYHPYRSCGPSCSAACSWQALPGCRSDLGLGEFHLRRKARAFHACGCMAWPLYPPLPHTSVPSLLLLWSLWLPLSAWPFAASETFSQHCFISRSHQVSEESHLPGSCPIYVVKQMCL